MLDCTDDCDQTDAEHVAAFATEKALLREASRVITAAECVVALKCNAARTRLQRLVLQISDAEQSDSPIKDEEVVELVRQHTETSNKLRHLESDEGVQEFRMQLLADYYADREIMSHRFHAEVKL